MRADPCRGIVLAAGRGSRLGERTAERPKCLVELGGRSLLDWQIAALGAAGISPLGVVRGYRADLIVREQLHTFDNPHWERGQMVASLCCARSWLSAVPCVVAYGDVVFHPRVIRALCATTADLAITYDRAWRELWSARFAHPEEDAESFRTTDGHLAEIGRRVTDLDDVQGQFMGLLRCTPAGWRQIDAELATTDADTLQTTELLQLLVTRGARIATVAVDGGWCEVDSATDLSLYERCSTRPGWRHDWRHGWSAASAERDGGVA
jgi:choline kinase